MSLKVLQPAGWPTPKGYANGMEGRGRHIIVGGMIGWDSQGHFAPGFVGQVRQALVNVLAVVREAGGGPEHIARLTWYVTDIQEYRASLAELELARDQFRAMLSADGPPPEGRFSDISMLAPVKNYPARHASTLLAFDAVVDAARLAGTRTSRASTT
jgi:enamine deaminase RidA (YjgF/YER057c/UK114 family)